MFTPSLSHLHFHTFTLPYQNTNSLQFQFLVFTFTFHTTSYQDTNSLHFHFLLSLFTPSFQDTNSLHFFYNWLNFPTCESQCHETTFRKVATICAFPGSLFGPNWANVFSQKVGHNLSVTWITSNPPIWPNQHINCISPHCKLYFSELQNIFLQITKYTYFSKLQYIFVWIEQQLVTIWALPRSPLIPQSGQTNSSCRMSEKQSKHNLYIQIVFI